jgi:hypothetical protein
MGPVKHISFPPALNEKKTKSKHNTCGKMKNKSQLRITQKEKGRTTDENIISRKSVRVWS